MLSLEDISSGIGGTLEVNSELMVSGRSEPKFASEAQLALALSDQYIDEISLGKATVAYATSDEASTAM